MIVGFLSGSFFDLKTVYSQSLSKIDQCLKNLRSAFLFSTFSSEI